MWEHDQLDQSEGTKVLRNRMSVSYENVYYGLETLAQDDEAASFLESPYYDNTPSTLKKTLNSTSNVGQDDKTFSANRYDNIRPPSTGQLTSGLLTLGKVLRAAQQIQELKNNPRQAWTVYGFNIKNQLTNSLSGAIFSSPARVTGL